MITVDITIDPSDEGRDAVVRNKIEQALRHTGQSIAGKEYILVKRSIDARHGKVRLFLRYKIIDSKQAAVREDGAFSAIQPINITNRLSPTVVIVGTGPAALFCALTLLRHGIRPILVERGECMALRKRDIAQISKSGTVDGNSNYCFGLGGAGTFSDGKLYTRSDKRGDVGEVLRTLVEAGADKRILTDSHPHIGSDILPLVVNSIVEKITEAGGEFRLNTRCVSLVIDDKTADRRVRGIVAEDTHTGVVTQIRGDAVMLATGHSASDIYTMLDKIAPSSIAVKGFAVGLRVEHPRKLIDSIQYHTRGAGHRTQTAQLGAAEYRLTAQVAGRGVYSFCMCPGGFVVPAATGPNEIVTNGMSAAGRCSEWSNAAIVMEVRAEDIIAMHKNELHNAEISSNQLAGLAYRSWLERKAYTHGQGQKAPAQRLTDFLSHKESSVLPRTSYTPGVVSSRLDEWLPQELVMRLAEAFRIFDKRMQGFVTSEAVLIACETRTSSPVRILRDKETLECSALHALYAAGEGAGWAGGIVSSAFDGNKVAEAIAMMLSKG